MPLTPKMSEDDYRELLLAMRRQPHLARPILDVLRRDPKHLRYGPALLDVRRQGTTLQRIGEDFGVSATRIRQLQARFERRERWEQQARAAMEQDPAKGPISALGLDERTTKALERVGIQRLRDAAVRSDADLLAVRDVGRKGLRHVREALARFGLSLATKPGRPGVGSEHLDLADIDVGMWMDVRSMNALTANGIMTIADLVTRTEQDLMRLRHLGPVSLKRIRKCLASRGLTLARET